MTVYELTQNALYLQELLEQGDIDEQVYRDSLESMCADDKLESCCMVIKNLEHRAAAYKAEIDRMTARKKTLENSVKRLKASMLDYLETSNTPKVEMDLFTVSVGTSTAVKVTDRDKLPQEFVLQQEPKIDKTGLAKAIKAGEPIDGAELESRHYLSIR